MNDEIIRQGIFKGQLTSDIFKTEHAYYGWALSQNVKEFVRFHNSIDLNPQPVVEEYRCSGPRITSLEAFHAAFGSM